MTIKTKFNVKRMFDLYPETKEEVQYKSNIIDVSHFVGYMNANEGKDDKTVLKIADQMFSNGLLTHDVFNYYLNAENNKLIETINSMCIMFNIDLNYYLSGMNNKQLYKTFKLIIKDIYNK